MASVRLSAPRWSELFADGRIHRVPTIKQRGTKTNDLLAFDAEPSLLEQASQYALVDGLEQTRTQVAMNVQCGIDDCSCNFIRIVHWLSPRLRGSA
jgi:hypothetical protein